MRRHPRQPTRPRASLPASDASPGSSAPALTRRAALLGGAALLAAPRAAAQGYAGLGSDAEGYLLPSRDTRLSFPADHAPHPGFRIEWWYVTANLRAADGTPFGIQWTLFRQAIAPPGAAGPLTGWSAPDLWLAHAAATSADAHRFAEKQARGGVGQAGVSGGPPFDAWIDDWAYRGGDLEGLGAPLTLSARGEGFSYALTLSADRPLVLHDGGYSVKSERGQASHYYSQPWYAAEGLLALEGPARRVTGRAWLDREWSSQPLDADQEGWDWFSLRLASGPCVMLYRLRHGDGRHYLFGSWIGEDGAVESLGPEQLSLTPLEETEVKGRAIPTRWRAQAAGRLDVTLVALNPEALMETRFSYWEGPVFAEGVEGYMELVGY